MKKALLLRKAADGLESVLKPVYGMNRPSIGGVDKDISYGPHPLNAMDVYRPGGGGPHPVFVWIHGGGWVTGDKSVSDNACRRFASRGFVVFSLNYRLAPEHRFPEQFRDIDAAMAVVIERAEGFGGDAGRMFIGGDSAGAHLSSWYACALLDGGLRDAAGIAGAMPPGNVRGLILFYGVYDVDGMRGSGFPFSKLFTDAFLGEDAGERIAETASPAFNIPGGYPPCFITAAQSDRLYSQSVDFADTLRAAGVEVETAFFPRAAYPLSNHGYLNFPMLRSSRESIGGAAEFMKNRQ